MSSVSVVIPAYNAERYLATCLRGVIDQQYPELEVIVVDDGSTDATSEIARRFVPRIRYHRQENRGVAEALNAGIELATGDYVSLVASDDGLCPGATAAQAEQLDRHARVAMVYGGAIEIDEDGHELRHLVSDEDVTYLPSRDAVWRLLAGNNVTCSSVIIRRSFFLQRGGFRQEFVPGEDWELWLRVAAEHDLIVLGQPLALRRLHGQSLTAGFTVESLAISHEQILRSLFSETPLAREPALERYAYAANERTLARQAAWLRDRPAFFRHLRSALRREPALLLEAPTYGTLIDGAKALLPEQAVNMARRVRHSRGAT